MINSFKKKHPWLIRYIKEKYWLLLEKYSNYDIFYYLDDWDFYIKLKSSDESVSKPIFFGYYEKETCQFAQKILRPGNVVYDIGANIGFFTILFSHLVGGNGKIHAFEPSRREFFRLCGNVFRNKLNNVFVNQIGVAEQNGFATMAVMKDEKLGAYNTLGRVNHRFVRNAEVNKETIRLTTLDAYYQSCSSQIPDFLKVDVEGLEYKVFLGGQVMLKSDQAPIIVFELCDDVLEGANNSSKDVCELLIQYGYSIYNLIGDGNITQYKKGYSQNAVATKEYHLQRIHDSGVVVGF